MKKVLLCVLVALLLNSFVFADENRSVVPTVDLSLVSQQSIFHNGDQLNFQASNFPAEVKIVAAIMVVYNSDGSSDLKVLREANYQVDGNGVLYGTAKLQGIDSDDQYAEIFLSTKGVNVRSTERFTVEGNLEPFSTQNPLEGSSLDFTEASGDGIVQLNETLTVSASSSDWTGPLIAAARREYSDAGGTTLVATVGLSIANLSVSSGQLTGTTNNGSTAYNGSTLTMRLSVMDQSFLFTNSTTARSTVDNVAPTMSTATATALNTIRVVFDEGVSQTGDASAKFKFSAGDADGLSVSTVTAVGTEPTTTWDLTLSGNLADRDPDGWTVTYDRNLGGGTLDDNAGNEVADESGATVADQIAPATPTLNQPVNTTIFTGTTVALVATAESGTTDPSMTSVRFEGSNDGSSWTNLGSDTNTGDATYAFVYTISTKYAFYRAVAVDDVPNETPSSSSPNLLDSHRIEFTTVPASLDAGVRGRVVAKIQNNYQDPTNTLGFNSTYNLTTTQGTGTFYDAASGGSAITQVTITSANDSTEFWYSDSQEGTAPTITITESGGNLDVNSDANAITINASNADHFLVETQNSQTETAGTTFNITVTARKSDNTTATGYVGSKSLTWSTTATASPDGTSPSIPADGARTFSNGVLTITNAATLYNSSETPTITVTDGKINTTTASGAGAGVTVNDGATAEARIKIADETADGQYAANVLVDSTFQGPTQANPDKSISVFAVIYDAYGNLRADETGTWSTTANLDGSYSGNPSVNNTFTFSSGGNAGTTYTGQLIYASDSNPTVKDSSGIITVDDNAPGTVTGFNITTDSDDNRFVFATWTPSSSGDDGTTGTPTGFDIRWTDEANGPINTEGEWSSATSVGSSGKPSFSTGTWRINMASFPQGNKYFAIRTTDDVGNISVLGSGAFTLTSDFSLPVSLTSFSATLQSDKVRLSWETASEVNNEGFFIYRSTEENGPFVQSLNTEIIPGQGNTNNTTQYEFIDENVDEETTYYYRLSSRDFDGTVHNYSQTASITTLALPEVFSLSQNYPNPFNPTTQLKFSIPESGEASLLIYNVLGQKIRTIFSNSFFEPGVYNNYSWDARDDAGNLVANGIYYLIFTADNNRFRQVKKMAYIR